MHAIRFASTATVLTTMSAGGNHKNDIEPSHLAELIKKGVDMASLGRLIIVDCRRFLDYNTSHIKDAVNVCCSKLIRKRLQENKMSIWDVLRPSGVESNESKESESSEPGENHWTSTDGTRLMEIVLYAEQCGTAAPAAVNVRPGVRKCSDDVSFLAMLMDKLSASPQFQSVRMLKAHHRRLPKIFGLQYVAYQGRRERLLFEADPETSTRK